MFPNLYSKRLNLTEIKISDRSDLYKIFSNELAMKYYGINAIKNIDDATSLIHIFHSNYSMQTGIRWGIRLKNNTELIGTIGLQQLSIEHKRCEVGYELHPKYWGKGFATEALHTVLEYTFLRTVMNRIGAIIFEENAISEKVVIKNGFQKEGKMREFYYQNNQYYSVLVYSLMRKEWLQTRHNR